VVNNSFLPDWCRDPLVYYDEWIASLFIAPEGEHYYREPFAHSPKFDKLPREAQAILVAHAFEQMPGGFDRLDEASICQGLCRLAESSCVQNIHSGFITDSTRARVIQHAPNMIRLLKSRSPNLACIDDFEKSACASALYGVWDGSIGWCIERLDFAQSRELMVEQIRSEHLPSVYSGLHGIGHRPWRILGSGRPEPFDWETEVTCHVLQRERPQALKDYAVRALARDVL
jgi:hypothetical protein